VTRQGLIGFIEVKAPGKGSDPTAFPAKSARNPKGFDRVQIGPALRVQLIE
jgi:hypothetical protein